jgi:hypothetical protein
LEGFSGFGFAAFFLLQKKLTPNARALVAGGDVSCGWELDGGGEGKKGERVWRFMAA